MITSLDDLLRVGARVIHHDYALRMVQLQLGEPRRLVPPPPEDPVWARVALLAARQRVSPALLVRGVFAGADRRKIPDPATLMSDLLLSYARDREAEERRDVAFELRSCANRARVFYLNYLGHWDGDPTLTWRQVAASGETDLSALYRHSLIVAGGPGFEDLRDAFFDLASAQYFWRRRFYDEAWGDFIPDDLRHLADDMQARVGGSAATGAGGLG